MNTSRREVMSHHNVKFFVSCRTSWEQELERSAYDNDHFDTHRRSVKECEIPTFS
jgi:hypothetical protein